LDLLGQLGPVRLGQTTGGNSSIDLVNRRAAQRRGELCRRDVQPLGRVVEERLPAVRVRLPAGGERSTRKRHHRQRTDSDRQLALEVDAQL
jgi:hypothetical protein